MNRIDNTLPDWIATHASLNDQVDLDDGNHYEPNERLWYLLTLFCPLIFENYAVVLHSYWIDYSDKRIIIEDTIQKNEERYTSINWHDFFKLHHREFNLKDALSIQEEIRVELLKDGWPKNTAFPNEGDMDNNKIRKIRDVILELYGDIEVNYYYCILKTTDWFKDEIIYKGRLAELEKLWLLDDIRDNPSAIFPDTKDWCIVTNYDADLSYIGGTKELLDKLTALKGSDIYPIVPKGNKI